MDFKQVLIQERDAILKRLEHINEILKTFGDDETSNQSYLDKSNGKAQPKNNFPKGDSQANQIIFLLEKENRFLHNNEISDLLLPYWNKDIKWIRRRVSAVLSEIKRDTEGAVTNIKVNNNLKNTFWGSRNWLLPNGTPKKENMYDESLVDQPKTKDINF